MKTSQTTIKTTYTCDIDSSTRAEVDGTAPPAGWVHISVPISTANMVAKINPIKKDICPACMASTDTAVLEKIKALVLS